LSKTHSSYTPSALAGGAPRFDAKQLLSLNRRILHSIAFDVVADRLPEGASAAFWHAIRGNIDLLSEARHWWEITHAPIDPPEIPEARSILQAALASLPDAPWDESTWKSWTTMIAAETGTRGKALFMPLRLALTGEPHGPDLAALLPLMTRTLVVSRLERAAR
jgi:glutamyl-tRNA synthetase